MSAQDAVTNADVVALELTARRPRTWSKLVREWAQFVDAVEAGYELTTYDYHNDLDVRGTIENVLDRLGTDDPPAPLENLDVLDRRFAAATREIDEVVATYCGGFWACRVPTKVVGELAADLASRGPSQE